MQWRQAAHQHETESEVRNEQQHSLQCGSTKVEDHAGNYDGLQGQEDAIAVGAERETTDETVRQIECDGEDLKEDGNHVKSFGAFVVKDFRDLWHFDQHRAADQSEAQTLADQRLEALD